MFKERIKGHPSARLAMQPATAEQLHEYLCTHESTEPGVIYFHVPFCDHICSFCAMNRSRQDGELDAYADELVAQIERYGAMKYFAAKPIASVYFGGGTPTTLKKHHFEAILSALKRNFRLASDAEICSESTLHNLSNDKLELMQLYGVNRYSIGIQSFSSDARKFFNRTGDSDYAIAGIKRLRERFAGTLCCDIIYNYPDQSDEAALRDAELVTELGIDSVSFYSLMYFEGSELAKKMSMDYYRLERDKALHDGFLRAMKERGWRLLEHTKLVRRDEYRYIRMSHAGADILPLGVGAGGGIGPYSIYTPRAGVCMISRRSEIERDFARFYNLFQYETIDAQKAFALLPSDAARSCVGGYLERCESAGYLSRVGENWRYTDEGVFYGNNIASGVIDAAKPFFKEILCK